MFGPCLSCWPFPSKVMFVLDQGCPQGHLSSGHREACDAVCLCLVHVYYCLEIQRGILAVGTCPEKRRDDAKKLCWQEGATTSIFPQQLSLQSFDHCYFIFVTSPAYLPAWHMLKTAGLSREKHGANEWAGLFLQLLPITCWETPGLDSPPFFCVSLHPGESPCLPLEAAARDQHLQGFSSP